MGLETLALAKTNDLPINHVGKVHSGKVRSVYWLTNQDSKRIIEQKQYPIPPDSSLGVMVISDKISAFECNWQGEEGLKGIPGKGACLNAISKYWFEKFDDSGLAGNHILDSPHPLIWIVQKAEPIMIEAIARQYITGSMWRAYHEKGERVFCGIELVKGLRENQRLQDLLITPSTKGILRGIPGVPEEDDVNITKQQILENYQAFGFKTSDDIAQYEKLLKQGFKLAEQSLNPLGKIIADTKFEFGYVKDVDGNSNIIYIDEVLTPDSSRFWDIQVYNNGGIMEESKEGFRQFLLKESGLESSILKNKKRMEERKELAESYRVPIEEMMNVSQTYKNLAKTITGSSVLEIDNPREEVLDALSGFYLIN